MALLGCLEVTLQAVTKGSVRLLETHGPHKGGVSLWRSNDATVPVAGDPWSYKGGASCRSTRIVAVAGDLERRRGSFYAVRSTVSNVHCRFLKIYGTTMAVSVAGDPRSYKGSASCRSTRIVAVAGDLEHLTTVSVL